MSFRPHGHARVSSTSPEAFGKCDRCGSLFNLCDLSYQYDWAGRKLINKHIRVCRGCLDKPQDQLRVVRLGADPIPVRDPRPLNNQAVMGGYAVMTRTAIQGIPQGFYSDSGADAGSDATVLGPAPVTLGLSLDVVTTEYAPLSAGHIDEAQEHPGVPLSIDPSDGT